MTDMTKTLAEHKTELSGLLVVELRAQAKGAGHAGYSKMRKAELVDLLASDRAIAQAFEPKPLAACEHGTAPHVFCQGCSDAKPAYAAKVDKVRAMRERVLARQQAEANAESERAFDSTSAVVKSTSTTGRVSAVAVPGDWRMRTVRHTQKCRDDNRAPRCTGECQAPAQQAERDDMSGCHVTEGCTGVNRHTYPCRVPTAPCMSRFTTAKGEHWCSVLVPSDRAGVGIAHEGPCVEITPRGAVEGGVWAAMRSNAHLVRPAVTQTEQAAR